jgi:hypothetical protein
VGGTGGDTLTKKTCLGGGIQAYTQRTRRSHRARRTLASAKALGQGQHWHRPWQQASSVATSRLTEAGVGSAWCARPGEVSAGILFLVR